MPVWAAESGGAYTLPLAADGTRGGIQIGYSATGANIPVALSSEKAYVALTASAIGTVLTFSDSLVNTSGDVSLVNDLASAPSYAPAAYGFTADGDRGFWNFAHLLRGSRTTSLTNGNNIATTLTYFPHAKAFVQLMYHISIKISTAVYHKVGIYSSFLISGTYTDDDSVIFDNTPGSGVDVAYTRGATYFVETITNNTGSTIDRMTYNTEAKIIQD